MAKEYQNVASELEEQEAKLLTMKKEVQEIEQQKRRQIKELEMK